MEASHAGRGPLPLLEETKIGLTSGYGGQFQGFQKCAGFTMRQITFALCIST
ncbi:uncharacterized protein ARMOST_07733 [Armillaria ostoyae]|uniref:Uncharacterized protein n=1 Tax=Armillaria ostoyae TaxID=47428 RepID=A0A284R6M9_ARMOS|nr:uncharacterized protein ARMOST_07733 [Armillaria ostoyae]